jgi:hypothetical protein
MAAGLVKGEGFAVDATVIEANANYYHGKAPDELDWTDAQRQQRAPRGAGKRPALKKRIRTGGGRLDRAR